MSKNMSSLERVLTTMSHKEPDQIPLFLMLTYHGARELDMPIKKYFGKAENIVKAQLIMRDKYKNDCLNPFYYSAIEVEAFGGEVIYTNDGPPNSGEPIIKNEKDIIALKIPSIKNTKCLVKVLETIENLRKKAGPDVPILGAVSSPFTLPIMQMGFDKYIELIYERPKLFNHIMAVNEEFCVEWANAQLSAGATAISYIDPMAAPSIIPTELYSKTGFYVDRRTIRRINCLTGMSFASACCLPILDHIIRTGTKMIAVSFLEDIEEVKKKTYKKLALLGNLNNIEMCRWDKAEIRDKIKDIIIKAGRGGGLIICDSAGEIPIQVSEETLLEISATVNELGKYPLDWID
ncbi:uroporphyrinogen decarboxylase family protein [Clostridium sp. PL3]|uniref:Uroporphyrinogen decarboxylase family protein n=1 Tax=Clostridium thailandense TaxID=2794346 RepID=A0A949WRA8_9CLOT|nr:uroporphyrinogen decarboxylase family protein [Clostridium thailandense]MBV7273800.1 uroporphyrinogen decarboxylase family protein [Clostridium thailandense]